MIGLFVAIFLLFRRCVALCGSFVTGTISSRFVERFRTVVRPGNESRFVQASEGALCRRGFVESGSPPTTRAEETPLRTFAGTTPSIRFLRLAGVPIDLVRHRRLAPLFVRLSSVRFVSVRRSRSGIEIGGASAIAFS